MRQIVLDDLVLFGSTVVLGCSNLRTFSCKILLWASKRSTFLVAGYAPRSVYARQGQFEYRLPREHLDRSFPAVKVVLFEHSKTGLMK